MYFSKYQKKKKKVSGNAFKIAVPSYESSDEDDVPLAKRNPITKPSNPTPINNQDSSEDEDDVPLSQKVESKKRVVKTEAMSSDDDDVPLAKRNLPNARKAKTSTNAKPIKIESGSDSEDEIPLVKKKKNYYNSF
jgi:hypothetical protein